MTGRMGSKDRARRKKRLYNSQNGKCFDCGIGPLPYEEFFVEHRTAHSKGGVNALKNLVGLCLICNIEKADKDLPGQKKKVEDDYNWDEIR